MSSDHWRLPEKATRAGAPHLPHLHLHTKQQVVYLALEEASRQWLCLVQNALLARLVLMLWLLLLLLQLELHVSLRCCIPKRMVKAADLFASATPKSFTQAHVTSAPDMVIAITWDHLCGLAAEQLIL